MIDTTSEFIADRQFRTKLKMERVKAHMTQADVAAKSGLSRVTVGNIENPDRSVEYLSVLKYIDALDLELELVKKPDYMIDK